MTRDPHTARRSLRRRTATGTAALLIAVGSMFGASLAAPANASAVSICEWGTTQTRTAGAYWHTDVHVVNKVYYQIGYACNTNAKALLKVSKTVITVTHPYAIDPIRVEDTYLYKAAASTAPIFHAGPKPYCTMVSGVDGCSFTATVTVNLAYPYSTLTTFVFRCQCTGVGTGFFWFKHEYLLNAATLGETVYCGGIPVTC